MYTADITINNKNQKLKREKLLTIGIITKNECEKLERCLKSLMPLKEAFDCEIIVTDTGSTDNTIEMAKKYADQILHFEWNNDFASARNTGIKAAKGLWFMWIDSDEWLENLEALIDFFKNGEYKRYGSANISFINLFGEELYDNGKLNLLRLTVLLNETEFCGKIHETLSYFAPIKDLNSIFYHDGYRFISKEQKLEKNNRNLELLLEAYYEKREDISIIRYISNQYIALEIYDLAEKFCGIGLELSQKIKDSDSSQKEIMDMYEIHFKLNLAEISRRRGEYNNIINILAGQQDTLSYMRYKYLDVYAILSDAYEKINDIKNATLFAKKYMDNYLEKDRFDLKYKISFEPIADGNKVLQIMFLRSIDYFKDESNYDEEKLIAYIDCIREEDRQLEKILSDNKYFSNIIYLIERFSKYNLVRLGYRNTTEIELYESKLIQYMKENKNKSIDILNVLDSLEYDTNLIKFSKILKGNIEIEDLKTLIKSEETNFSITSEIIYLIFKNNIDISELLNGIDIFDFGRISEEFILEHNDIKKVIIDYNKNKKINDLKCSYVIIAILERLFFNEEYSDEIGTVFLETLPDMVSKIYDRRFLKDENIFMLPPIFRFGYYVSIANEFKEKGDIVSYLKELKRAVTYYPKMKTALKLKLLELEIQLEKESKRQMEIQLLSIGIKQKIYEFITLDKTDEALAVICQLQSIIPDDKELKELKSRIISK